MKFRTAQDYSPVKTPGGGQSMTKQEFKKDCDINVIMARYQKTGALDHFYKYGGNYGDFVDSGDFHHHMNVVTAAQQMFETVPAEIRKRFGNDPALFLEFAQDPANEQEMVDLGLLSRRPEDLEKVQMPASPEAPSGGPADAEPAPAGDNPPPEGGDAA